MQSFKEETDAIMKGVRWAAETCGEIQKAGGAVEHVLSMFPDDLINTMIRNGLHVKYRPQYESRYREELDAIGKRLA